MAEEINNTGLNATTNRDTFADENRSFDTETLGENDTLDTDILVDEDELAGTTSAGMSTSTTLLVQPTITDSTATAGDFSGGIVASTAPSSGNSDFNTAPAPVASLKEQASDLKDQAVEKTHEVLTQTKETATVALNKAKEQAVSQISTQKERAAESLTGITSALHQTGQSFRDQDQHLIADYVESVTHQVDRFTDYVRTKSVEELARDVEGFARHNPALFVGGAFLLGIGLARFLKSSNRYDTIPRNEALVPVYPSPMNASFNSSEDAFGENRPLTAHNYVPGVGVTGSSDRSNI